MKTPHPRAARPATAPFESWAAYCADAAWRSVAFMDLMRQRADDMIDHQAAHMPPLLHFEGTEIADARTFAAPCNYRLLEVTSCPHHIERHVRRNAAPVVVVDPRAGHGPGIGGFKRDSEVGMAMLEGHPTYFVVFDPEPVEGQTMGAVVEALARFIDIVSERHRNKAPIVYGNCQGGWAVALALSHCRRKTALAVLNGSPLSYWAGEEDVNPMRLAGGLLGGVWPAHLAADLGNGKFDGAWLVQNFEGLRPEAVWKKYDHVFASPDVERERFLEFERWWSGFYQLGREEILGIVRDLFIGNRVEKGEVVVNGHCRANLAGLRTPLVIFCSRGDNITPPAQALAWLTTVFGTTDALVRAGQRIVYMVHEHVGHLGIFVSADVARHEHRAILHHAAAIQALPPGLYEMSLDAAAPDDANAARARFEPRRVEDLPFEPRPASFDKVNDVSIRLDDLYTTVLSPIVRSFSNEATAQWLQFWHPARTSRMFWSSRFAPAAALLPLAAGVLEGMGCRDEGRASNSVYAMERAVSDNVALALEWWRHLRDRSAESAFKGLYAV